MVTCNDKYEIKLNKNKKKSCMQDLIKRHKPQIRNYKV